MAISPEVADIIRRKKAQYCRFADTNQWHLFDRIMLPEATFCFEANGSPVSIGGDEHIFSSRQEFVSHFSKVFESLQTIHLIDHGDLEQTGPDEVKAVWGLIYYFGLKGSDTEGHEAAGGHVSSTQHHLFLSLSSFASRHLFLKFGGF